MFKTHIFRLFSTNSLSRCALLRSHVLSIADSLPFARFVQNSSVMSGAMDSLVKKSPKKNGNSSSDSGSEKEDDDDVVCITTTVSPSSPKLGAQAQQKRRITRQAIAQVEREKSLKMTKEEKRTLYKCKERYVELEAVTTWPEYLKKNKERNKIPVAKHAPLYEVSDILNKKVSLWRGDITTLEIDAIVNAANNSLLGGGGVDGAIHFAAGSKLREECSTLGGCDTGDAKISAGYKLPAKYIIHTVGPIGEKEKALKSAYNSCLKLVQEHKIRSVAFPCISTGIYGYSNHKAAPVAIETARRFLEEDGIAESIDRVIFCLFMPTDVRLYEEYMPMFFPLEDKDLKFDVKKPRKSVEEENNSTKSEIEDSSKTKLDSGSSNKSPNKISSLKGDDSDKTIPSLKGDDSDKTVTSLKGDDSVKTVTSDTDDKDSLDDDDEEVKVLKNH